MFVIFHPQTKKIGGKKENSNASIQLELDDASGMSLMEIAAELIFISYIFLQMDIWSTLDWKSLSFAREIPFMRHGEGTSSDGFGLKGSFIAQQRWQMNAAVCCCIKNSNATTVVAAELCLI